MNRDDVIRWADEADLWADQELQCVGEYHPDWHEVRDIRFAALVAAAKEAELAESITVAYMSGYEKGKDAGAAAEREAILQIGRDQWFKTQADFEEAIRARRKE